MNCQYYTNEFPDIDELVLVEFIDRNDSFFNAHLVEYNLRGMLTYQNATKKRKVSSWNKLVPLNKKMVAKVEEVDTYAKIVQISLAYLPDLFQEDLTNEQVQEKLMNNFMENKNLELLIKLFCKAKDLDINNFWTTFVHYIDELRREYNQDNDENISIWKYFIDNIKDLEVWMNDCEYEKEFADELLELYSKKIDNKTFKYTTKIGIISLGGIEQTKSMLKNVLSNINYNYQFRYDTTPYYLFETMSEDSTIENHQEFINMLENESKKYEPKIFIKSDCKTIKT
jgi:translation initiation factor 2 alpha subunit (eIF-2alpha)